MTVNRTFLAGFVRDSCIPQAEAFRKGGLERLPSVLSGIVEQAGAVADAGHDRLYPIPDDRDRSMYECELIRCADKNRRRARPLVLLVNSRRMFWRRRPRSRNLA